MLELNDITWDNFWAVTRLRPTGTQARYTLDNAMFIAQGYLNLKAGYLDTLKTVTYKGSPIGFVKWVQVPKTVGPYHLKQDATLIDAFMLDRDFQGKGYGKAAFKQVIAAIEADVRFVATRLLILCHVENKEAHAFFERFGFIKTGKKHVRENEPYLWFERTT